MTAENRDHGPLRPDRIPASPETTALLSRLNRDEVAAVEENWTADQLRRLPPTVKWLVYPNGDLQRL